MQSGPVSGVRLVMVIFKIVATRFFLHPGPSSEQEASCVSSWDIWETSGSIVSDARRLPHNVGTIHADCGAAEACHRPIGMEPSLPCMPATPLIAGSTESTDNLHLQDAPSTLSRRVSREARACSMEPLACRLPADC